MLTLYYKDGREIIEESTKCGNSGCLGEPWCSAWGICSSLDSSKHAKVMEFSNLGQEDQYDYLFSELSQQEHSSQTCTSEHSHFTSTFTTNFQNQFNSSYSSSQLASVLPSSTESALPSNSLQSVLPSNSLQSVHQSSSLQSASFQSSPSQSGLQFSSSQSALQTIASVSRFSQPVPDDEIVKARIKAIPKKTRQDTDYCVRLWNSWRDNRRKLGFDVPQLSEVDKIIQAQWLTRFILEVRKINGSEYPPNTLYHIVNGIMRHVRISNPGTDFYKDAEYSGFIASLNAEMKRLQSKGMGSTQKQAEPLSTQEEEQLWENQLLGDHSPQALLNTMVFMIGLYFALRSGDEHRNLRRNPYQIKIVERSGQRSYLEYTEDSYIKKSSWRLKRKKN